MKYTNSGSLMRSVDFHLFFSFLLVSHNLFSRMGRSIFFSLCVCASVAALDRSAVVLKVLPKQQQQRKRFAYYYKLCFAGGYIAMGNVPPY